MSEVLAAEGVHRRYGETVALDGVSLSVGEGEVFGLVGPNGAGKTTLVRALTGTTDAEGAVQVFGRPPTEVDPSRVGLLPQSFAPAGRLTARELLQYYRGLYDEGREVEAVLRDVGLADVADTWYEKLSGGQQRRACVGATLVNDPDLLFLDEPTTGIDPAGRRSLWSLLEELADGGATVFLTSHSMAEIERLADRVGLLADGRLLDVGAPAELVRAHGGASRLTIRTDAPPSALAEFDAERTEDGLVVRGVEATEVGAVVDSLSAAGARPTSLAWNEPGLEDVYLRLAGDRPASESGPAARDVAAPGGDPQ
jgi:ABC-2 type transport system ATP-binding protein